MASTKHCVFLDWETKSKRPIEDGAFAYAADPSTEILVNGYCIEDQDYVACDNKDQTILHPLWKCIEDGYEIVAHNMLFEIAIYKSVAYKEGWPLPSRGQFRCTMQMAGRAGLPLSLADCAKALNIVEKLESGKGLIKLFSVPQKDGRFIDMDSRPREKAKFIHYCGMDCVVSREIWRNLPEWKESEIIDVLFDLNSNMDGVPVDVPIARKIYAEVLIQQAGFAKRVDKLTNGIITKMTQVQRVKQWVQTHVNPGIPNGAAETIIEILDGKWGTVDAVSQEILEMRQHSSKSSTGKYVRYINSSVNGRIMGMTISFGAHTGRGVSKLLNLYNLPKPSIKYESMDILIADLDTLSAIEIHDKYGSYLKSASTAIRGVITAPEGKILAIADYSAIEARLVFWLAQCTRGLKLYYDGVDAYKAVATVIFHKRYENITDDERWVGKQVILGAGYGLGAQGFVNSCARWGVEVSLELAQEAINAYRGNYPEVVDMWNELERSSLKACRTGLVISCCKDRIAFKTHRTKSGVRMLQMRLPSGRCINYPHVSVRDVTTPWGEVKKAVTYRKVSNGGFFRESTYGGKLAENAIQGIARDIFYYGAEYASKKGYEILFGVYDEVIGMADEEDANIKIFEQLICKKPKWADGLPLEAEGKLQRRYQKI